MSSSPRSEAAMDDAPLAAELGGTGVDHAEQG